MSGKELTKVILFTFTSILSGYISLAIAKPLIDGYFVRVKTHESGSITTHLLKGWAPIDAAVVEDQERGVAYAILDAELSRPTTALATIDPSRDESTIVKIFHGFELQDVSDFCLLYPDDLERCAEVEGCEVTIQGESQNFGTYRTYFDTDGDGLVDMARDPITKTEYVLKVLGS